MTERLLKVLPLGVFGSLAFTLVGINTAPAQEPIPLYAPGQQPLPGPRVAPLPALPIGGRAPAAQPDPVPLPLPIPGQPVQPAQGDGIEVLARGPVHEAFASTAEAPVASPVVAKQPPEPIEELPPDQKPAGDNVQWIPGYWSWDEEGSQFIWISGFWRQPPPGRAWIPGAWREVKGGWQYVPGFWQELAPRQPQQPQQPLAQVQPEIEYLPQPPQSLEIGPSNAAPSITSVYVPGSWVWRGKYFWRPGVWVEHRADWVWAPARYHWTPAGYVFCDGYWDYPLSTRGVLFAPVVVSHAVYTRDGFVYTPVYVVSEPCMTGALFVRRGHGNYYFGDYFEPRYATVGYSAWCGSVGRNGFAVGYGVGRSWGYDPLWSHYSVAYRDNPRWHGGVNDLYAGRYRGDIARPPVTLVQQNTTINNITRTNITNVTNNITVVNGAPTVGNRDVSNVAMVAPLRVAPDLTRTKFVPVSAESQRTEATAAKQIRDVGAQRTKLETAVVNQPRTMGAPGAQMIGPQPQTIKLDVPKTAAARAAISTEEHKAPPPDPLRGAKVDPPKGNPPKVNPPVTPITPPVVAPKVNPPVTQPPVNPLPKADPKPVVNPPVVEPKVEPKPVVLPPVAPKVNPPAQPVLPPVAPKVEPKPPVTPLVPRVDPKPVAPPVVQPKPPVLPPVAPRVNPPVAPPPVPPKPAVVAPPVAQPQPKPPVIAPPVIAPPAPQPPKPVAVVPPVVQPTPKPVVVAPPVPRPQPAPVAVAPVAPVVQSQPVAVAVAPPAQPRPAAAPPAAPPVKVVQPTKPPAAPPQPAPPGKPAKKSREE